MLQKLVRPNILRNTSISTQQSRTFSLWAKVDNAPPDPILGLNDAFKKDTDARKVLLGMGAYRTDEGKPLILDCVKKAEMKIMQDGMDHEYSGIDGIPSYR